MKKTQQEDIPRSIIKGSGIVVGDLSSLNGKGKLLFVDPKCFVVGVGNLPYILQYMCYKKMDSLSHKKWQSLLSD